MEIELVITEKVGGEAIVMTNVPEGVTAFAVWFSSLAAWSLVGSFAGGLKKIAISSLWAKRLLLAMTGCVFVTEMRAEQISLQGGAVVSGTVLREDSRGVVVDLGFELLRVPIEQIVSRTPPDSEKSPEKQSDGRIYRQAQKQPLRTVRELNKAVGPATVQVRTESGLGSGFIISPEGHVITNNHVISGSYEISVLLYETGANELKKVTFDDVELVAQSPLYDLALLKIKAERTFPTVPLGERNALAQGEDVFAVGSPLGLERSVSQGIVSVRNRVFPPGVTLIQHTAQINPGNSGGPLFNRRGEVVGVNNLKLVGSQVEGLGFAIPITHVLHFIENRDAYAFDPRNPNAGYRYLAPPGAPRVANETSNSTAEK